MGQLKAIEVLMIYRLVELKNPKALGMALRF
jgi:hypothetical protein